MKYKVLKPFVDPMGNLHEVEEVYDPTTENWSPFVRGLIDTGYIEKVKDEPWKPKEREIYFAITACGNVSAFTNEPTQIAEWSSEIGNCFQTKEQAEKAVKWLKAFKVLRDDTKGFKPDWKARQRVFYVQYDYHDSHELEVDYDFDIQWSIIYFATEADAEGSIKKHEKEWKIFLGIEESN